jgi:hypothetical protein
VLYHTVMQCSKYMHCTRMHLWSGFVVDVDVDVVVVVVAVVVFVAVGGQHMKYMGCRCILLSRSHFP